MTTTTSTTSSTTTTTTTTAAACFVGDQFPVGGCREGIKNKEFCTAETIDHYCVEQGSLTFACPDGTEGLPEISWNETWTLGDHWGEGAVFEAWDFTKYHSFRRWGEDRRTADLVNYTGGFDVHCRVCDMQRNLEDMDIREGHMELYVTFGPNMFNGIINETGIASYCFFVVTACHERVTDSLGCVDVKPHEWTGRSSHSCACPHWLYDATIHAEIPADVLVKHQEEDAALKLMISPKTIDGDILPIGLSSEPIVDFYTTTTTTTTSSTTNTTTTTTPTTTTTTSTTSTTNTTSTTSSTTTTSSTQTSTTSSTTTTTGPVAHLMAVPESTRTCQPASFSGLRSHCDAGYELIFDWRFGAATPAEVQRALRGVFTSATARNVKVLELSSQDLTRAARQARGGSVPQGPIPLEVEIAVTNFEGTIAYATAFMEIHDTEQPPEIGSVEPSTALSYEPGEEISFAVWTRETAAGCSDLGLFWDYRSGGSGGWRTLEDAGLVDLSRMPTTLRFAPRTFEPETYHEFRARANYGGSGDGGPSVVFSLNVLPYPPPTAIVNGPAFASPVCDFTLDASASIDSSTPPGDISGLSFEWSCSPFRCTFLPNFADEHYDRVDGLGARGITFLVQSRQLVQGTYTFTVRVRSVNAREVGTASITVVVQRNGIPPVSVAAPWDETGRVSVQAHRATVVGSAVADSARGCPLEATWDWHWAVFEKGAHQAPLIALATSERLNEAAQSLTVSTFEFPGGLLTEGIEYEYGLLWAPNAAIMAPVVANGTDDLAAEGILVATVSSPFIADAPPHSGVVAADPPRGEAVTTTFLASTMGWQDDLAVADLLYAFFRFPSGDWDWNSTVAEIQWDDASSPRYWGQMGGRMVQLWAKTPEMSQGMWLTTGSYVIVAVARDAFGGKGAAVSEEIVVAPVTGGLLQTDAEALLDRAAGFQDPVQMLLAAEAVAGAVAEGMAASQPGSAAAQVMGRVVDSLEGAVDVMDVSDEGVQQVSQITESVVSGGTRLSGQMLDRVASVLENLLDTTAAEPTVEVSEGCGNAVLGSITGIDSQVGSDEDTGREDAHRMNRRLLNVVSDLGTSVSRNMQPGERRELSSVGADGSGVRVSVEATPAPGEDGSPVRAQGVAARRRGRPGGRRLQAASSCDSMSFQQAMWSGRNPHRFAPEGLGRNDKISASTTVKVLEMRMCGQHVDAGLEPMDLEVSVPITGPEPAAQEGWRPEPMCLFFDSATDSWSEQGLSVAGMEQGLYVCSSTRGAGSYAAVYHMTSVEPTTVTTTSTEGNVTFVAMAGPATEEGSASLVVLVVVLSLFSSGGCLLCSYYAYQHAKVKSATRVEPLAEQGKDRDSREEAEERESRDEEAMENARRPESPPKPPKHGLVGEEARAFELIREEFKEKRGGRDAARAASNTAEQERPAWLEKRMASRYEPPPLPPMPVKARSRYAAPGRPPPLPPLPGRGFDDFPDLESEEQIGNASSSAVMEKLRVF